ncbi:MAG: hypothetical protein IPM56_05710 [Ignavibacteriales bacterium]|nr:MAG: hypothetical protein IPM56_05710 [Ignavibacteriales bacterium]
MTKVNKTNLTALIIFALMILSSATISGQSQNSTQQSVVDNLTTKLEQKVLLNNEQVTKVKDILHSYFNNRSESSLNSAKEEVEKLLDNKQKAKYGIIKNEWWKSISTAVISK